jgi:hypothetical protein
MSDKVIVINDRFAIERSFIQWLEWTEGYDKGGEKVKGLVIGLQAKGPGGSNTLTLVGVEAERFWKEYTGSTVSWDTGMKNRMKNEEMRARHGLPIHYMDPRNAEFENG